MDAHDEQKTDKAKETVIGTFKRTREILPNGDTKEVREETTVTLRHNSPEPVEHS